MSDTEPLTIRVPTNLADDVEQFADQEEISKSEAGRQLLRGGLEAERHTELVERLERIEEQTRPWWARLLCLVR